ncbi:Uncharacterised protein [Mycobacteroides abscessus]|nr:Uncharacterised protein [Mycobacteroides abscessus]
MLENGAPWRRWTAYARALRRAPHPARSTTATAAMA